MRSISLSVLVNSALVLGASLATPALLAAQVSIQEWTVPYADSRPRDPYVDGRNRIWFVGQKGNYLAYLEPETGKFKRYELEDGALPHNLIVDQKGMVWYAGNGNGHIGKLDPATGKITRYPMPNPDVRDPHTLVFDDKGDIWFTAQNSNYVGRLRTGTGKIDLIEVPSSNARPYGIAVDSKGRPWFNEFGNEKIASIDPVTLKIREHPLPNDRSRTRRLVITSDDRVWFVDYSRGYLGRFDPATSQFKEWALPGGTGSLPYAMAVDNQDRPWMVETGSQPNRFVGFDPETEKFFGITPIPSGGGTVRHMMYDKRTGQIWFGTDNNTIGRAVVTGPSTPPSS